MEQRDLINKLFSWTRPLDLRDGQNQIVMRVYQRLVGDSDIQKARMSALRYSRELRNKFKDTNSDEYVALVSPVEDLDRESLIMLLLVDSVDLVRHEIDRTFYFAEPKEPDEYAPTEEHEEYAAKWESWEHDRELEYSKHLVSMMDQKREEFNAKPTEELIEIAKRTRIDALCDQELKTRFIEMCVVYGTYEDDKFTKHLFPSYTDFAEQVEAVKSQLLAGYAELEMSTIGLKESTKSPASEPESPSPSD